MAMCNVVQGECAVWQLGQPVLLPASAVLRLAVFVVSSQLCIAYIIGAHLRCTDPQAAGPGHCLAMCDVHNVTYHYGTSW